MLEKQHIEDPVVAYAVKRGFGHRKMNGMGARSWPDQLFLTPGGRCFFVEFKKPGVKPTDKQSEKHEELRALGFEVYVIDNKAKGIALIDRYAKPVRCATVASSKVSDSRDKETTRERRIRAVLRSRAKKNQHYTSRLQDST